MKTRKQHLTRTARFVAGMLSFALTLMLLTPAATMAQDQPIVNLGAAGDFALLAGSLVSNVPNSAVTGNIGLSPAAGSNITGFGGAEIVGIFYTVDATGPAGSVPSATMLLAAKGDITIAFNDAAGRMPVPVGEYLNPGAGNIGGMTLSSGLYKFTSTLSISGSDLTLTGSDTDVWIFQIASDLNVANGIHVTLAGGALPANIFWQVGTSATLGTTCVFQGTIIADQSIALNTGATLNGRALASSGAVTIEGSTVTKPGLTAAIDDEIVPGTYNLSQNFPNPFNPSTTISYQLPFSSQVTLTVTDMLGRELAVLVNDVQNAGNHEIDWDASNNSSGTYIYRLQAGSFVSVKQMVLVK
ncbi:MAG: ice-binding family protein [Candidatus Marinimicrobia bacterium]|nr:ice-binding family protein [Candidatus Neomarinimicrobiota bacterium]